MPRLVLYPVAQLDIPQDTQYSRPVLRVKISDTSSCPTYFFLYLPSYSPSCRHNNTQPTIHSWNPYRERQKGEAFDVYLQGSSLTSLSPLCELWVSWDLQLCQLGCKWCSCLCALLAHGTLVGYLASICGLSQHPASPNQNKRSISVT